MEVKKIMGVEIFKHDKTGHKCTIQFDETRKLAIYQIEKLKEPLPWTFVRYEWEEQKDHAAIFRDLFWCSLCLRSDDEDDMSFAHAVWKWLGLDTEVGYNYPSGFIDCCFKWKPEEPIMYRDSIERAMYRRYYEGAVYANEVELLKSQNAVIKAIEEEAERKRVATENFINKETNE